MPSPIEIPAPVKALFAGHEDYLSWSFAVEGNAVREGRLLLGLMAGPSVSVGTLLHEMAHLIEIDDSRCHLPGWGLRVSDDPRTFQCSERELRVFAIQKVLSEHVGQQMDLSKWVSLLSWQPDWWHVSAYLQREVQWNTPAWKEILAQDVQKRVAALDAGTVLAEWARKCEVLRERLT